MAKKNLFDAVRAGEVHIIETTRAEVRDYMETVAEEEPLSDKLHDTLDTAQGEADDESKVVYVVLAIKGGKI